MRNVEKRRNLLLSDDTRMLVTANSWKEIHEKASSAVTEAYFWLMANKLKMNSTKSNCIAFSTSTAGMSGNTLEIKVHSNPCDLTSCITNNCKTCIRLTKI